MDLLQTRNPCGVFVVLNLLTKDIQMNKKTMSLMIVFTMIFPFLQGCAGHTANPVSMYQPSDGGLSCQSILYSMSEIDRKVKRLLPASNKTGKNVAIGVVGAVIFWPALFFMDFTDSEKVEIAAYRDRYEHLARLYENKRCSK